VVFAGAGLEVAKAGVGIVLVVSEGVAVFDKAFGDVDGDGEIETAQKEVTHGGDADDFAFEVEERSAGVAGIDVGGGLDIELAFEVAVFGGDDALADGAGEAQGVADSEDRLAGFELVHAAEINKFEGFSRFFDFEQGQIHEGVKGDNLYLFIMFLLEAAVGAVEDGDFDTGFAGDDVIVGDEAAVLGDDEAGALAGGAGDHDDGFTDAFGVFFDGGGRQVGAVVELPWGRGFFLGFAGRQGVGLFGFEHLENDGAFQAQNGEAEVHHERLFVRLKHVGFELGAVLKDDSVGG